MAQYPLLITNNENPIVANFHQDLMASSHKDFFSGHKHVSLIYWPGHSRETWLKEEEDPKCKQCF
jgi:hypothetical protein